MRKFLDAFYGFSVVRRKSVVINLCYFLFDIILYPNSMFFSLMVSLFFLLILLILLVTLLNYLGWTNIDLDAYAGQQLSHRHGLTPKEMEKLERFEYRPKQKQSRPAEKTNLESNSTAAEHGRDGHKHDHGHGAHQAEGEASEVMCSICFVPFEEQSQVVTLPQCEHLYHWSCISEWFRSHGTCPICRLNIKTLLKEPEEDDNNNFLNKSMFEIADI